MKKWGQKAAGLCSAALTFAAVVCVLGRLSVLPPWDAAFTAAGFIMPGGAAEALRTDILEEDEEDDGASHIEPPSGADSRPVSSVPENSSQKSQNSSAANAQQGTVSTTQKADVKEMSIVNAGVQYKNIWVKNSNKNHGIDIPGELKKQPAVKIAKNAGPQVLIYHTHTTEAFAGDTRSRDASKNVVAVGERIAAQLRAAGINTIHDATLHDYPSYNGSYERSKVTVLNNLKKYPSIQVALDIHRDAMGTSGGTRIKPTAVVNGKKAAQVMIIAGCDDDGTLNHPNWEYNLRLAVRIQQSMADQYPGLGRPLNFCNRKYNQNLTKGSLLVEFGTEVNTLDEATYSGELFGKALAAVLNKLT
ncbi:stage II sporulation protein P [Caproiciproducens galactitolivorans]|uniref:Stage II sporulation protein SpoIIP n=1 Tax=Caproiciproducens galactitolivorans TaxID=642589 RepID=A0A4Z0XZM6_9FIRM|nr:stage II sporulation protein P [Caproiciproducens galactitolivorans]QEY35358.1 stage II sporulation protein P [Caproiciproducens galactitolivorans]TGJ77059.1 stage II sporulation protein SpoIIP [Caproiciproducens galactitolivorans]